MTRECTPVLLWWDGVSACSLLCCCWPSCPTVHSTPLRASRRRCCCFVQCASRGMRFVASPPLCMCVCFRRSASAASPFPPLSAAAAVCLQLGMAEVATSFVVAGAGRLRRAMPCHLDRLKLLIACDCITREGAFCMSRVPLVQRRRRNESAAAVTRSPLVQSSLAPSLRCCIAVRSDSPRPLRFRRIRSPTVDEWPAASTEAAPHGQTHDRPLIKRHHGSSARGEREEATVSKCMRSAKRDEERRGNADAQLSWLACVLCRRRMSWLEMSAS